MPQNSNKVSHMMADEDGYKGPQAISCFTFSGDLLKTEVRLNGKLFTALLDTGSSVSLSNSAISRTPYADADNKRLKSVNGNFLNVLWKYTAKSRVIGHTDLGSVQFYVLETLPHVIDVIIGSDLMLRYEVKIEFTGRNLQVSFSNKIIPSCFAGRCDRKIGDKEKQKIAGDTVLIEDNDFVAEFNNLELTVKRKFLTDEPTGRKYCHNYKIQSEELEAFDQEINEWIREDILVEWNEEQHGKN